MAQDFREVISESGYSDLLSLLVSGSGRSGSAETHLRSLSPLALAYVGDAVYELFVRTQLLMPPRQIRTFHREVVDQVRAEQQAHYLNCLKPYLTDAETDILRRARNAASGRKVRASLHDYRQATALEALLGYLYLKDWPRLMELLAMLPIAPSSASTP